MASHKNLSILMVIHCLYETSVSVRQIHQKPKQENLHFHKEHPTKSPIFRKYLYISLSGMILYQPFFHKQTPAFPRGLYEQDTNLDITTLRQPLQHEPNATLFRAAVYSSKLLSFQLYFTILELRSFVYRHFLQKWVESNQTRQLVVLLCSRREARVLEDVHQLTFLRNASARSLQRDLTPPGRPQSTQTTDGVAPQQPPEQTSTMTFSESKQVGQRPICML